MIETKLVKEVNDFSEELENTLQEECVSKILDVYMQKRIEKKRWKKKKGWKKQKDQKNRVNILWRCVFLMISLKCLLSC